MHLAKASTVIIGTTLTLLFSSGTALAKAKPVVPKPTCTIKGNISSPNKEKIYHLPGCASYKATVITTSAGERMFCTEKEARDAGWRKALNCPK